MSNAFELQEKEIELTRNVIEYLVDQNLVEEHLEDLVKIFNAIVEHRDLLVSAGLDPQDLDAMLHKMRARLATDTPLFQETARNTLISFENFSAKVFKDILRILRGNFDGSLSIGMPGEDTILDRVVFYGEAPDELESNDDTKHDFDLAWQFTEKYLEYFNLTNPVKFKASREETRLYLREEDNCDELNLSLIFIRPEPKSESADELVDDHYFKYLAKMIHDSLEACVEGA